MPYDFTHVESTEVKQMNKKYKTKTNLYMQRYDQWLPAGKGLGCG